MWQQFVTLFTAMEPIPAILIAIGIIFCIIEMFVPGFGFFGISGGVSILAGIILRFIREFNLIQLFLLVLMILVLLGIFGLIVVHSAKKGLISKTPLINNKTAIPVNFENEELKKLINKTGLTITECKPLGKAEIDGKEFEIISQGDYLNAGIKIQVLDINDNVLVVNQTETE